MDFFRGFYTAGGPDVVEGGTVASWRVDVDACPPGAVATRGMVAPVAGRDGRVLESKDSSAVLGERGNRGGGGRRRGRIFPHDKSEGWISPPNGEQERSGSDWERWDESDLRRDAAAAR